MGRPGKRGGSNPNPSTLRLWEHEVHKQPDACMERVKGCLSPQRRKSRKNNLLTFGVGRVYTAQQDEEEVA